MLRVLPVLLVLAVGIYAFVDCLGTEENKVRGLPKLAWVFIILLFPLFGTIGWFVAGRPRREWAGGGFGLGRPQGRQLAPDDDPDFLASLGKPKPKPAPGKDDDAEPKKPEPADQEEMLKRWEEDLKRPEDDLRSPDQDGPEGRAKD